MPAPTRLSRKTGSTTTASLPRSRPPTERTSPIFRHDRLPVLYTFRSWCSSLFYMQNAALTETTRTIITTPEDDFRGWFFSQAKRGHYCRHIHNQNGGLRKKSRRYISIDAASPCLHFLYCRENQVGNSPEGACLSYLLYINTRLII